MAMYLKRTESKLRQREAQNARNNRAEIVKALSHGQINKRDLFKWGLFTSSGMIAAKNGLSPFVQSAHAEVPTGTPPSPTNNAQPFTHDLPRLLQPHTTTMQRNTVTDNCGNTLPDQAFWTGYDYPNTKVDSYCTDFANYAVVNGCNPGQSNPFVNPVTGVGPMEGRPPGHWFSFQRWGEYFPTKGYCLNVGPVAPNTIKFHPQLEYQDPTSVWSFNEYEGSSTPGTLPPPLLKMRYGEPVVTRIHNLLPADRTQNGGFGRNEISTHFHNAHNGAESDGANNAFYFPGQFYDFHWSTTLARRDMINTDGTEIRASGPRDSFSSNPNYSVQPVAGDFREIQGTMWFHDHRFFFTAENVYKGNAGMINMYSGPDRGNERISDGVNHRLPSGFRLPWGNCDFDVNLMVGDLALDQNGQLFFDIFNTDGFLGDLMHVNYAWAPKMDVLPRKYRFRILNCSMSRFIKLAFVTDSGSLVPFQTIANDGNLLRRPISQNNLDIQGSAERFDIVMDFSDMPVGTKITMINRIEHDDGRGPKGIVSVNTARFQRSDDPAVGPVMQFVVADRVPSVDMPGAWNTIRNSCGRYDRSEVPLLLTEQIPIITPKRERVIEFKRDSLNNGDGVCIPECGEDKDIFPWVIRINGESQHSLNANRISMLIPEPGETEHWTLVNGGGGWDHPVHLHFEEGITMNRGGDSIPATERFARKDVWRLRESGQVQFQVTFGEYGGAYVTHCHNTVHEDFAMLLRYDIVDGEHVTTMIPTPIPTPYGVTYMNPEVLPEGDPRHPDFDPHPGIES